jgi:hypothetical protein
MTVLSSLDCLVQFAAKPCTGAQFMDLALPCDRLLSFIYLKHDIGKSAVIMESSIEASRSETERMRKVGVGVGVGTAPCS